MGTMEKSGQKIILKAEQRLVLYYHMSKGQYQVIYECKDTVSNLEFRIEKLLIHNSRFDIAFYIF